MRSAAGGSSGDGSVDVKMLAEQNVQLKEALKRLHTHSIAEKTDVSALVRRVCCVVSQKIASNYRNVYLTIRVSGATAFQFDGHTVNNWIYVVCTTFGTHPSSSSNTHTYPSSTTSMSYPTLQTFGENGRNQPPNASLCC